MDAYLSKPVQQAATLVAMIDRWIPYREAQPAYSVMTFVANDSTRSLPSPGHPQTR